MSSPCPVCGSSASITRNGHADVEVIDCWRCGDFEVSGTLMATDRFSKLSQEQRWIVSHVLRRMQGRGTRLNPLLTTDQLDAVLAESERLPGPTELCSNLILWIGQKSHLPGHWAKEQSSVVRAEIGAADKPDGLEFATEAATKSGWIEAKYNATTGFIGKLTIDGWSEFERLMTAQVVSRRAFQAMSFGHADVKDALEHCFRPAVKAAGFDLHILTDKQPAGLIDDQLRVALRTSRFVVADLSYSNRGAYWEAGFAEGLGKPVFYTCERDWFENKAGDPNKGIHFDTSHLNTVFWEHGKWEDARKRLSNMIRATLPSEAKLED